jgi:hypothetical protein
MLCNDDRTFEFCNELRAMGTGFHASGYPDVAKRLETAADMIGQLAAEARTEESMKQNAWSKLENVQKALQGYELQTMAAGEKSARAKDAAR